MMNLNDTQEKISKIKGLDLRTISNEEMMSRISTIGKHLSVTYTLPAGTVICRSVDNFLIDKRYPITVGEVSYNANLTTCRYNRANWEGESVFYGSITGNTMKSLETSCMEVMSLQQNNCEICQETIFAGKWVLQENLELVFIGGSALTKQTQEIIDRNNFLINNVIKYSEDILPLKIIDSFLCHEFSKSVSNSERWQYKISASYAGFLKQQGWAGILYPSVQTNGAGLNVALFPHVIDNGVLKLEYVAASIFRKRGKDIVNEYVMEARPDKDKLIWKETYNHRLPPEMKAYYSGKSDDNSFQKSIPSVNLDK